MLPVWLITSAHMFLQAVIVPRLSIIRADMLSYHSKCALTKNDGDSIMADELDELFEDDEQGIEAYCMTCKQTTPMENPEPIWTRRGAPGTRGTCSVCGTVVFRMGKTPAHNALKRPEPIQMTEAPRGKASRKIVADVTYLNYSVADSEFAEILAEDLKRIGIPTWMAGTQVDDAHWATGVHPALVECKNMVVVLTPLAIKATNVQEALRFFVEHRKPIVVAQLQPIDLPDELRRKPRFDFSGDDYRQKFRELVRALTGG